MALPSPPDPGEQVMERSAPPAALVERDKLDPSCLAPPKGNRILSKVQKPFWSCTHVNSCQKYTLYVNLHILLNILYKATLNIQESKNSIK